MTNKSMQNYKKNKPSQKQFKNNAVRAILKDHAERVIERYRKVYERLPKEWVIEQDELIDQIANYSWEKCQALIDACLDALATLEGKDIEEDKNLRFNEGIKFSDRSPIRDWQELFGLARDRDYITLRHLAKKHGIANFILGYWLMFELAQKRRELYADEHPNERAVIYLHHAKALEKLGYLEELEESYKKLLSFDVVKKALSNPGELSENDKLKLGFIHECLVMAIKKALEHIPLEDQIMKVMKGDKALRYIPHVVFRDIEGELIKENTYKQKFLSLDASLRSEETFKDRVKGEPSPEEFLLKILETQKQIEKLTYLKKLVSTLPNLQRKSVEMHFQGFTFKEIGERRGIRRQTAHEHYKSGYKKIRQACIEKYPSLDT